MVRVVRAYGRIAAGGTRHLNRLDTTCTSLSVTPRIAPVSREGTSAIVDEANDMNELTKTERCLVVGIGGRLTEDYLPAIAERNDLELVGGVDRYPEGALRLPPNVPFFTSVTEAIRESAPTVAIVATPHRTHFPIVTELVRAGVAVLKEKPFALNQDEATRLGDIVKKEGGFVKVAVQRRSSRIFKAARAELQTLGTLRHFTANYHLRTPPYGDTWRASMAEAGGGALVDMGYHTVDLLSWYFGVPEEVSAMRVGGRESNEAGGVEESVAALFHYRSGLVGKLFLSRCEPEKSENLRIIGSKGALTITPTSVSRSDASGRETFAVSQQPAWPHGIKDVLDSFLQSKQERVSVAEELSTGTAVNATIDAAYRSMRSGGTLERITIAGMPGRKSERVLQQAVRSGV